MTSYGMAQVQKLIDFSQLEDVINAVAACFHVVVL